MAVQICLNKKCKPNFWQNMIDHGKCKQPKEWQFISQCPSVKTSAKHKPCHGKAWFPHVVGVRLGLHSQELTLGVCCHLL